MHFCAVATFGVYVPICQCSVDSTLPHAQHGVCAHTFTTTHTADAPVVDDERASLGIYQRALLCWSFTRALTEHTHVLNALSPWLGHAVYSGGVYRRHMAFTYDNTSVHNLLYVRFREGFALKSVVQPDATTICIQLRLPWMPLISIEYHLRAAWPQTYYQVFVNSDIALYLCSVDAFRSKCGSKHPTNSLGMLSLASE